MKTPPLKIGIDVHGVADADPEFYSRFTALLVESGNEVHILTGSEKTPELEDYLKDELGLSWTHLFSITSHHREMGTEIASIHGNPYMDEETWNRTKAEYCRKNGIQLHLDDSPVYGGHFDTPYARYAVNRHPDIKKKIAVIGGSFNPVTSGHLEMAQAVLDHLPEIRQVWLMPAYRHPFEKHRDYAAERIRLIRLVESGRIRYFGYEIDHKLSGETYVTFTRLLDDPDYRHRFDFHMVIGSDCVLDFDTKWKHAGPLSELIRFIIIPRPGHDLSGYRGLLSRPPHVILEHARTPDVSATTVRERLGRGLSIEGMVPESVRRVIEEKRLYRGRREEGSFRLSGLPL